MKKYSLLIFILICIMLNTFFIYADEDSTTDSIEYENILIGDADDNGIVESSDALKILKIIARLEDMDNRFSIRKNDFNNDYKVTTEDALSILKVAARLEEQKTIADINGFFSAVEYVNGYPLNDYTYHELDELKSFEYGILLREYWNASLSKHRNGEEFGMSVLSPTENGDAYDEIYWELRWLLEDAIKNEQLLNVSTFTDNLFEEITNEDIDSFVGYFWGLRPNYSSSKESIRFIITRENKLYIKVDRREISYFYPEYENSYFEYTGELPEGITYDNIEKTFYEGSVLE